MDYKKAENKIKNIILSSSNVLEDVVVFLYENFDHYTWVGIYIVKVNDLILGPWKGPHATEHTRIQVGKGICGSAAASGKTEVIPDVTADDRYLSCFISTKSEIVIPINRKGKIVGEIDIDSDVKNAFNKKDKLFLEKIAEEISSFF